MAKSKEEYKLALDGKKIPILVLDNKWHQVFTKLDTSGRLSSMGEEMNSLLKEQGKLNTECKEIKKLKTKLVQDLIPLADSLRDNEDDKKAKKKLDETKRLIDECNQKLENNEDRLIELPRSIKDLNYNMMLETMQICYESIRKNDGYISDIAKWISQVRVELKKNLIRKQEREQQNQELYSYMHDIFGADVIEVFDMKYNPTKEAPKDNKESNENKEKA